MVSGGGFRGRNPPASLKLQQVSHDVAGVDWFPGEKSPGLIEAFDDQLNLKAAVCFRGRNPPASLKLHCLAGFGKRCASFPGEKSPGLIEAPVAVRVST